MEYRDIIILIIIIIIIIMFFQIQNISKNNNYENAENTGSPVTDAQLIAINNQISSIYNMDVEAIRNLGAISKSLLTGTNYHSTTPAVPGTLTIPADNTVFSGNLTVNGSVTFSGKDSQSFTMNIMPIGTVIAFANAIIPQGWSKCDGTNGTPDLRGRFILGDNPSITKYTFVNPYKYGGQEDVILTVDQLPSHTHAIEKFIVKPNSIRSGEDSIYNYSGGGGNHQYSNITASTGTGQPHNNMPPYCVLIYIMKIS